VSPTPEKRRQLLLTLLLAFALLALTPLFGDSATPSAVGTSRVQHPELFLQGSVCSHPELPAVAARRSEELAHVRADRYAYDPADGVRAVELYGEAEACYRLGGLASSASRVHAAASLMIFRLTTDYAAARLSLARSLEQERWSAALREVRRLLRLTHHLGRNEYVDWLEHILRRAAARATEAPEQ
jgi:hypothetical protein